MESNDLRRIAHIKHYCEDIDKTVKRFGDNYDIFITDTDYINSVSMSIMQIGELTAGLSDDFKDRTKDQMQWGLIRGMRNMFAHTYQKMDKTIIFDTAINNIPELLAFCNQILNES